MPQASPVLVFVFIPACVWVAFLSFAGATSTNAPSSAPTTSPSSFYDLSTSPYESTQASRTTYSSQVAELNSRLAHWANLTLPYPGNPSPTGQTAAFKACGGVCPWLTNNYKREVKQEFFPSSPPHIVFILVDDWGYNDVGYRSTYMNWTTPNIDALAAAGIKLSNYYTHWVCAPSRGAFLTGRYALRFGMQEAPVGSEMPINESFIGQEMKRAGYHTSMIGKWHQGFSSWAHTPTFRGFDDFYGFYSDEIDYWNKTASGGVYVDLQDGTTVVTDSTEKATHLGILLSSKAEKAIKDHANDYAGVPLFLYYAPLLVHYPYEVPTSYLDKCSDLGSTYSSYRTYCGMNIMLDETVANLTCALERYGLLNNTIIVIAGDNGGSVTISGSNVPFRGSKGYLSRGGVSANALIYSPLLNGSKMIGHEYFGLMHVTDWLPTLMGLASEGKWTKPLSNYSIDGLDVWDSILANSSTGRTEVVHNVYYSSSTGTYTSAAIQIDSFKIIYGSGGSFQNKVTSPEPLGPAPSMSVCFTPTSSATRSPTSPPSAKPSSSSSSTPSTATSGPTSHPSATPASTPSLSTSTSVPTSSPSTTPTPTSTPASTPSSTSSAPTSSNAPTAAPVTQTATQVPSVNPSSAPTSQVPSFSTSSTPTVLAPSAYPTSAPTVAFSTTVPTRFPTLTPTSAPTQFCDSTCSASTCAQYALVSRCSQCTSSYTKAQEVLCVKMGCNSTSDCDVPSSATIDKSYIVSAECSISTTRTVVLTYKTVVQDGLAKWLNVNSSKVNVTSVKDSSTRRRLDKGSPLTVGSNIRPPHPIDGQSTGSVVMFQVTSSDETASETVSSTIQSNSSSAQTSINAVAAAASAAELSTATVKVNTSSVTKSVVVTIAYVPTTSPTFSPSSSPTTPASKTSSPSSSILGLTTTELNILIAVVSVVVLTCVGVAVWWITRRRKSDRKAVSRLSSPIMTTGDLYGVADENVAAEFVVSPWSKSRALISPQKSS